MGLDPQSIGDPDLRRLYAYWAELRGDRRWPARKDVDPAEIKALLPYIMLVDVQRDPLDFRVRLTGTEIVSRFGEELTGRRLGDIDMDGEATSIFKCYADAATSGEPRLDEEEFVRNDGRYMHYYRLLLPLSGDGTAVDMLLVGHRAIAADGHPAADLRRL